MGYESFSICDGGIAALADGGTETLRPSRRRRDGNGNGSIMAAGADAGATGAGRTGVFFMVGLLLAAGSGGYPS